MKILHQNNLKLCLRILWFSSVTGSVSIFQFLLYMFVEGVKILGWNFANKEVCEVLKETVGFIVLFSLWDLIHAWKIPVTDELSLQCSCLYYYKVILLFYWSFNKLLFTILLIFEFGSSLTVSYVSSFPKCFMTFFEYPYLFIITVVFDC